MDTKNLFFNYLLEETKRKGIKLSFELFLHIWSFIDSVKGKESMDNFSKTKLPSYCSRQLGIAENPFKRFLKDNKNVN